MKVTSLVVLATTQLFVVSAGAADLLPTQRLHSIDVFELEYTDDVQISRTAAASSTCVSATTS